jgi:hypothetical protein
VASIVDTFSDTIKPKKEESFLDKLSQWGEDIGEQVTGALSGLIAPTTQGMVGAAVGTAAAKTGVPSKISSGVAQDATQSKVFRTDKFNVSGSSQAAPATLGALAFPLIVTEAGYRGTNTVVGGATLVGADFTPMGAGARIGAGADYLNPLYRDGITLSDIPDTFRMVWGSDENVIGPDGQPLLDAEGKNVTEQNAITSGQAISSTIGVTLLNAMDTVVGAVSDVDLRENLNKKIEESSVAEMNNPENTRKLMDWTWGLHTEFDIYNKKERESAFNQGLGRWISGAADSAVLWYLAPEVIGLKAVGMASRSLFIRSIDDFGDIIKMRENLRLHATHLAGAEGGQKTPIGRLVESLARMNTEQIGRHEIALSSTDSALIARTFGPAKTFDDVAERMLALQGDRGAILSLMGKDAVLADAMSLQIESLARSRRLLEPIAPELASLSTRYPHQSVQRAQNALIKQQAIYKAEIEQADLVMNAALKENDALASAFSGLSVAAEAPNAVRLRSINVSKLKVGPSSVGRMEKKANKAVSKANGTNLFKVTTLKTGGNFGRTVRVWSSTKDYMGTARMKGAVDLDDTNDVIAELDSVMQTLPMLRQLMKKFQGTTFLPGTTQLVSDFRREIYSRITAATSSTERMVIFNEFESRIYSALISYHGVSSEAANVILTKYKGMRTQVIETVKAKGLVTQDGEIHVLKDMQSLLASTMPAIDFHFIEAVLRLERGSGVAKLKGFSDIKGSTAMSWFDSLWRPLVLIRLGYTTRNVIEGNLRELAGFKTLGLVTDRGMGTQAIEGALAFRAAKGFGRGIDRIARLTTQGSLKSKRNKVLRAQGIATGARNQLNEVEAGQEVTRLAIAKKHQDAENRARSTLTEEFRAMTSTRVSNTMEEINTESTGAMTDLADVAAEIIIPRRYILPIFSGGSKRSRFVAGFDTPRDGQVRAAMQDSQAIGGIKNPQLQGEIANDSPLALNSPETLAAGGAATEEAVAANIRNWLSAREAAEWDELISRANAGKFYDAELEMYNRLAFKASRKAVKKTIESGGVVTRTIDPTTGTYEIIHDFKSITIEDINSDALGILTADQLDKVEYVRANVFGSTLDLRASNMELPRGEVDRPAGTVLTESPFGKQPWDDPNAPAFEPRLSDPGFTYLEDLAKSLDIGMGDIGRTIDGRSGDFNIKSLYRLEHVLELAKSDPALAAALRLKMLVGHMPTHMQDWFKKTGFIINNKELKRLERLADKATDATYENRINRENALFDFQEGIKNKYWRNPDTGRELTEEEFAALIPSVDDDFADLVFHGGNKVEGDVLSQDPVFSKSNLENLVGIGFYTTRDPAIGVTYIFNKADKVTGENVLYTAVLPEGGEGRFVDLDAAMEVMPGPTGTSGEMLAEREEFLQDVFYKMHRRFEEENPDLPESIDDIFDDVWFDIERSVDEKFEKELTPLDATKQPRTHGINMEDYRKVFDDYFISKNIDSSVDDVDELEIYDQIRYASQMLWVNTLKDEGALGVKHIGGKNIGTRDHAVFVWYVVPEVKAVDEVTADFLQLAKMRKAAADLEVADGEKVRNAVVAWREFGKYQKFKPGGLDAAKLTDRDKAKIVKYMSDHGAGRIILDDSLSPSGRTIISSPDMISVSTDQAEAAIPGAVVGKDYVDNMLPQLESEAMARNPAVYKSAQVDDDMLLPMVDNDPEIVKILRGETTGTPEQRAKLAWAMESNGYSHVQVGKFGEPSTKFINSAELAANRKTGMAYGALRNESELAQTRNQILQNDDSWHSLNRDYDSKSAELQSSRLRLDESIESAKKEVARLNKRMGKLAVSGAPIKGGVGTGKERFTGKDFEDFWMDGPRSVNSQGSMYDEMTSSSTTNLANLYGYTDHAMQSLRQSADTIAHAPGSDYYFYNMAKLLNTVHRNDLISKSIFEGKADDEILSILMGTEWGKKYVKTTGGWSAFRGMIDDAQLTSDARDDMIDLILEKRGIIQDLVKDDDVIRHLADNEVTPDFLMSRLGWKDDLPTIRENALVDNGRGWYRNAIGNVMHVIGTLPEDALVRHPFFRARWREEIQRQADIYGGQGVTSFNAAQLTAMDRVAKKFAVQQVQESLYTITRLSTPAHVFKFIIPFFPAWASAVRFWMLQVPAKHPEAIARYMQIYNAPESMGWVYDGDGKRIQGDDNFRSRLTNKFFSGDDGGTMIIQFTNKRALKGLQLFTQADSLKVPVPSLDMMLQGENPFFPGTGPFLVIPTSYIASRMPDISTALETSDLKSLPFIGEFIPKEVNDFVRKNNMVSPLYKSVVPFGRPTQDKDIIDLVVNTVAPSGANKAITLIRGMSSAQFANTTKEIHRTDMTNWDLGNRVGPEPMLTDSIKKSQVLWGFRGAMSMLLPFATQYQSPYQFYIQESRRIDREVDAAGGTYDEATQKFVQMYGEPFFRYRQSLSGGASGMGANVGEFKEFNRDSQLMADLASIGDDASFITMATRPFKASPNDDGFDTAVYSWQMNRPIAGAPGKFIRGGPERTLPEARSEIEMGWIKFDKVSQRLDALAAEAGTTVSASEVFQEAKKAATREIGAEEPAWFLKYNETGSSRWIQSNLALEAMFDSGYFEVHKNDPVVGGYARAMVELRDLRRWAQNVLLKRAADGGSGNIKAKINTDLALTYAQMIEDLKASDDSGNFTSTWDRFFSGDELEPIPELED